MTESLLNNILVQLRIVSKIPEGGKLCTSDAIQIETSRSYCQPMKRWLWGESRESTVQKLKDLVDNVICISNTIIDSRFLAIHQRSDDAPSRHDLDQHLRMLTNLHELSDNIENSMKGFANLHQTYHNDATVTSKLENMMHALNTQNDLINQTIDGAQKPVASKPMDNDANVFNCDENEE